MPGEHYDRVIVGSGFGGCLLARRLTQKGYKVLVIGVGLARRGASELFGFVAQSVPVSIERPCRG